MQGSDPTTGDLSRRACLRLAAAALAMVARTRGDRRKAAADLADAFADGLRAPRRVRR